MADNKILGKSLADLMVDETLVRKVETLQKGEPQTRILLSEIKTNPYQPRKQFDQEKLEELASSIKQYGVFTPIIVRKKDGHYELIAGERRYRASLMANQKDIPAVISDFTDEEVSVIALLENLQRENLNPMEIANSLYDYQNKYGLTQQQLADKFGKSRPYVANILRLRQLPKSIQNEVADGEISMGHVKPLIGLTDKEAEEYLSVMHEKHLNVRQAEALVSKIKAKRKGNNSEEKERTLSKKLKAKVEVKSKEIRICAETEEELNEILKKLIGK